MENEVMLSLVHVWCVIICIVRATFLIPQSESLSIIFVLSKK